MGVFFPFWVELFFETTIFGRLFFYPSETLRKGENVMTTPETKPVAVTDADYSLEPVPQTARKKFWPMFFIMLGFTFFSASMSVGASLGNGLDFSGFVWAVLIGSLILSGYTGGLGYIGSATGMSLDLLAQRSFGRVGSYLPSFLISLTQIGWFGVGIAMFAFPASEVSM